METPTPQSCGLSHWIPGSHTTSTLMSINFRHRPAESGGTLWLCQNSY